jgi:6-phosphogluconate dehydrogenase
VDIAMVGLGKMGANMTERLLEGGHRVVVFDVQDVAIQRLTARGAVGAKSLAELSELLEPPRAVWVMLPAGRPTEDTVTTLALVLGPGDTILDGGNSYYKNSQRLSRSLEAQGIHFVDVGTSGGIWGRTEGYSLMVGGDQTAVERLRPVFETLAPAADKGWGHVGPVGAGHFVKMVHNGIEYGLMQAYAEGFDLMQDKTEFKLDLSQIAELWRHGSVVRSWLLDLTAEALGKNPLLEGIAAYVPDSGEGRWTVMESLELGTAIPVITLALQRRFRSRDSAPFSDKLLAALRQEFGGHAVKPEE